MRFKYMNEGMNRQTNEQMNNQMNEWMNTLIRGSYEHPIWAGDAHKTVEFNACSIYKVCGNMLSGEIFSVTVRGESDVADRKVWWWPRLLFSGTMALVSMHSYSMFIASSDLWKWKTLLAALQLKTEWQRSCFWYWKIALPEAYGVLIQPEMSSRHS